MSDTPDKPGAPPAPAPENPEKPAKVDKKVLAANAKAASEFLAKKKVLIVDPNSASRAGLQKTLCGIGAKVANIIAVESSAQALEAIENKKPEVIVSEYGLADGNGLELALVASKSAEKQKVFALVTSNSSQSLAAQAAEEAVDVFVLKPYQTNVFTDNLARVIVSKINPSNYIQAIELGKEQLAAGKVEEALACFKKAETLYGKPSLACYYRGQAEVGAKRVEEAIQAFREGLKFSPAHYRCLNGLFEVCLEAKKSNEAYAALKKITEVFPANPKRLIQILTLAVQTGNVNDVESYYEMFQGLDSRSEELIKHVCAAMVVCGRWLFKNNQPDRALEILKKASITVAGRTSVLRAIVALLVEKGKLTEAQAVLARFPADSRDKADFNVASFLIYDAEAKSPEASMKILGNIAKEGIKDPVLSYWTIRYLFLMGKIEMAENTRIDAEKLWPAEKALFARATVL